jgi:signal-transduction protein with cAMP-binding, CBS, and nucleotidyltransferase domain
MAIMTPGEVLDQLSGFPVSHFAPGEAVLSHATATGRLLFLREGVVDVAVEDVFIARVSEPGAVFGDVAFLLGQPHGAAVIAAEASRFHVVEDPEAFLEAEPRVAIYVAQVLARRLNAVNHLLAEARHRIDDPDRPPAYLLETLDRMGHALQIHFPTDVGGGPDQDGKSTA